MIKKRLILIFSLFAVCLIGAGVFYFSNNWKGDETLKEDETQTAQNLKLLNSHSHPEAGDEWAVFFETIGTANLTITPEDQDTVGDLDFVSLTCNGKERTEALQVLEGDTIFYPNWQCIGQGKLTHLVNIARKHRLKFQFSNKIAFAYNNPDSVTDTFTDESKVSATSSVVISGGQAQLATCKDNGTACAAAGECCTGFCVDSVCCDGTCSGSTCQTCGQYSSNGIGYCGYVNDSGQDPDNECPGSVGTCASTNCIGSDYACGYLSGQQSCDTCTYCNGSSYDCTDYAIDAQPSGCTGCNYCNGSGSCLSCSWSYQSSISDRMPYGEEKTCKPSGNNISRYFWATGPACSASGYTIAKYMLEMTAYHHKCICQ